MIKPPIFCSLLLASAIACTAQTDTVSITKNNLQTSYLKEGANQYIAWMRNFSADGISQLTFWERKISFAIRNGKDVIIVAQRRLFEDSARNTIVYTVSDKHTFQTIYDYRESKASGIKAYDYDDHEIKGADTIDRNVKKGFDLKFTDFPYCFELDIETLSMLPLKQLGQKLLINFYHPGGDVPPKYYPVVVQGEEVLEAVNAAKIDCWVIRLAYDDKSYDLSWISKEKHEFLKLESHSPQGIYHKVKLFTPVGG